MNNIIIIIGLIISIGIITYLQNKNYKKLYEEISKIKDFDSEDINKDIEEKSNKIISKIITSTSDLSNISNKNISELKEKLENDKIEILKEVKKVNVGEIQIENGKIKGNLFVEGNIQTKGDIESFH